MRLRWSDLGALSTIPRGWSRADILVHSMAKRAVFQATASMLLPSLTIHSIVRYSAIAIKKSSIKNIKVRTWAPSFLGTFFVLHDVASFRSRFARRPGSLTQFGSSYRSRHHPRPSLHVR